MILVINRAGKPATYINLAPALTWSFELGSPGTYSGGEAYRDIKLTVSWPASEEPRRESFVLRRLDMPLQDETLTALAALRDGPPDLAQEASDTLQRIVGLHASYALRAVYVYERRLDKAIRKKDSIIELFEEDDIEGDYDMSKWQGEVEHLQQSLAKYAQEILALVRQADF